jgi:hypothetical protein
MDVKRGADIPMSAYWTQRSSEGVEQVGYNADVRESASVAHIYGQNLVAAESLTAGSGAWGWSPEMLKPTADIEMAMGLNRFVIHTSVHQPVSDKIPGLGLGPFGQWFTRHEIWAELAKPWITYLSRSSYMSSKQICCGHPLLYGEDSTSPPSSLTKRRTCLPDTVLITSTRMRCQHLSVLTDSQDSERWPIASWCSIRRSIHEPPVLRTIRDMVRQERLSAPGLRDAQPGDRQGVSANRDRSLGMGKAHTYGSGKVYASRLLRMF